MSAGAAAVWCSFLLNALFAGLVLALLSLAGRGLLPRRALPPRAGLRLAASLSAGTAAFGAAATVVGAFAGSRWIPAVLAALAIAGAPRARDWRDDARRALRRAAALCRAHPAAAALAAAPLCLLPLQLALPLVDSDGLRYHVAFPKLWLLTGTVSYYPWDHSGGFPQQGELLYLLALTLAGGDSSKFLHAAYFLASLAVLGAFVHRSRRTRSAALLAPFLLAAAPVALGQAGAAFVDHFALFHLATGVSLLAAGASPALIGLAAGAGVAAKLTAGPGAAGLVAAAAFSARRGTRRRALLTALAFAALPCLPYAVRNTIHTGDPLYPLGHVLAGRPIPGVPPGRMEYATNYHGGRGGLLGFIWGGDTSRADDVVGWHHLAGLALLPFAAAVPAARPLLALGLPYVAMAFVTHPPARYSLPLFWCLAALEAVALARALPRRAPLAALAAAGPALFTSATLMGGLFSPASWILGRLDRDEFLSRNVPGYRAALAANALDKGVVMALDFPPLFYLDRPFIAEGVLRDPPLKGWIAEAGSAEEVLARLRAQRVRHLIVTPGYGGATPGSLFPLGETPAQGRIVLDLRSKLRLVERVGDVAIYEVPGSPP